MLYIVHGFTLMVTVDVAVFISDWKFVGVLDDVLVELVIKEGMGILLPGYCLHAHHVVTLLILPQRHQ